MLRTGAAYWQRGPGRDRAAPATRPAVSRHRVAARLRSHRTAAARATVGPQAPRRSRRGLPCSRASGRAHSASRVPLAQPPRTRRPAPLPRRSGPLQRMPPRGPTCRSRAAHGDGRRRERHRPAPAATRRVRPRARSVARARWSTGDRVWSHALQAPRRACLLPCRPRSIMARWSRPQRHGDMIISFRPRLSRPTIPGCRAQSAPRLCDRAVQRSWRVIRSERCATTTPNTRIVASFTTVRPSGCRYSHCSIVPPTGVFIG